MTNSVVYSVNGSLVVGLLLVADFALLKSALLLLAMHHYCDTQTSLLGSQDHDQIANSIEQSHFRE
jgi:hypothetical protein